MKIEYTDYDGKPTGETLYDVDTDCPIELRDLIKGVLNKKGVLTEIRNGVFIFKEF